MTAEATVAQFGAEHLEAPPLSLGRMTWLRFRRHKMAMVGVVMLILLFLYSFGGSLVFSEDDANYTETGNRLAAPSAEHPFGTDTIGRDILARTIYGGQISLLIGVAAVVVMVIIGVLIGAFSGFFGGATDAILMRFTEAVLTIPSLFLLLVMAKFFGGKIPDLDILGRTFSGSVVVIIVIIGLTSWTFLARIVRAEFLSLKENDFVMAARATGTPTRQIIFRHILPNTIAPIIVAATIGVAAAIICRGLHQLPGAGRAAAHGDLGQYDERRLQLYRHGPLAVVLPGPAHPADRAQHQFRGRRPARRP